MRIGELAAASGTTTKTLRFYEESGLLPPAPRTTGGYRDYDDATVDRLDFIRRGRAAGLTLAQIKQVLSIRDDGRVPCEHVTDLLDEQLAALDTQIGELMALRDNVAQLRAVAGAADPAQCSPAHVCDYL